MGCSIPWAAMADFSAAVRLADLDDFLKPATECVLPGQETAGGKVAGRMELTTENLEEKRSCDSKMSEARF